MMVEKSRMMSCTIFRVMAVNAIRVLGHGPEEIATACNPCTLREIACRVKEAHPDAPALSLDRLAVGLKARGQPWKRARLSL